MAFISEAEIKRQMEDRALARLYVVCGGEEYLKQHYAARICEAACDEAFRDFNFHRFEGKDLDLDTLAQATEAMPLGDSRTCVLVRDFSLDAVKDDKDFLALIKDLPEHMTLVFWMDTVEWKPKKNKALLEAIQAAGHILECSPPDAAQTLRLLAAGAKRRGCTIDRSTAQYLLESVGSDLNLLQNETQKLCAYAGEGSSITRAHIDAVCVKSLDARSFDMVKAVAAGDGTTALRLLDELFRQKVAPQMLLGSLAANYVDLFRAAMALQSGKKAEAPAALFDYKGKAFRLQNAGRMAARYPLPRVGRCLDILDQADRQFKSTGLDNKLVMEQCVIGLLGAK